MVKPFTSMGSEVIEMDDVARLRDLLMGEWQEIAVQGGELQRTPKGVYLLSGLWVHIGSKWIEISTVETQENSFSVTVGEASQPPVPEPSKMNHPPRKVVSSFPEDCRLDELGGVADISPEYAKDSGREVVCGAYVRITGSAGHSLNVSASRQALGFIELVVR